MFLFKSSGAPATFVRSGYEPTLDRLPPGGGSGCWRSMRWLFFALLALAIVGFVTINAIGAATQPAYTPTQIPSTTPTRTPTDAATATATLDGWSLTGTAMIYATASPTADYCAWLTPTATATATALFTPDAWQATGTAVFYLTNTPTPRIEPSATTPRSWCDFQTATLTPISLWAEDREDAATGAPTSTPMPMDTPIPPTRTPQPLIPALQPSSPPPLVYATDLPPIVLLPSLVPPTAASTRRPTRTPSETPTPTETATPTQTATLATTDTPHFNIYQSTCEAYPMFAVQNIGAPLGAFVLWDIRTSDGLIAVNGFWLEEMLSDGLVTAAAPAWTGVPGTYLLTIYQPWDAVLGAQSAVATCAAPVTATATASATPTDILPEQTGEILPSVTPTATATEVTE